jgi:hypothetical protein
MNKVIETFNVKDLTVEQLKKRLGKDLSSPIKNYNVGDILTVTLTGKLELKKFGNVEKLYAHTHEGFKLRVDNTLIMDQLEDGRDLTGYAYEVQVHEAEYDGKIFKCIKLTEY